MSDLAERLANLSPEQRELLARRLKDSGAGAETPAAPKGRKIGAPPIERVARDGELPLSFGQQRLWFLHQWEPDSPRYNIAGCIRFQGPLNVSAFERSLNEIVRRHESLRTTFHSVEGQPLQRIVPEATFLLQRVDLRSLPPADQRTQVQQWAAAEARRPFDLTQAPLLRGTLLQLGAHDHTLILVLHHIVSDAWSVAVLWRELESLYPAFLAGKPSPLPGLAFQYADYACWQRARLQGPVLEAQLAYWKQQLANSPATLELPADRPRPALPSYGGALHLFQLSPQLTQALQALSRRLGATLFMALLAAFKVLLYRYTGQTDIVIGTPIANRNRVEWEGLIGFFVNTLVLRTKLAANLSFREVLQRVREVSLGAYAHQDLPFEALVETLQVERSSSHTPVFQVMFELQNMPGSLLALDDLAIDIEGIDTATAKFDLILYLEELGQGLRGAFEYSTDLFDAATIVRLEEHYRTLLENIIVAPEVGIEELRLLPEAERRQVVVEWNATQADYPQDRCLHELFEAQATRTPDTVAVVYQDEHLTYRCLNERANRLAHALRRLGVGPDARVGVYLPRSAHLLTALLGILKAGGAYVPLDPAYPQERLAFMSQDAALQAVLIQERFQPAPASLESRLACLDLDQAIAAETPGEDANRPSGVTAHNLAYVIYTSGSTGQPKGIMIQHRSAVNLAASLERALYAHRPRPLRVSLNGSISFDTSVKQLLQLLNGHTLCLLSEATRFDVPALIAFIQTQALDVLDCTPSQLRLLLEGGLLEQMAGAPMQTLVGGEAIDQALWTTLAQSAAPSFYNVYGPTECTVDASLASLHQSPARPTLGRPIANVRLYVLDRRWQPTPIGVPGELFIGGAGLARGYLNRPALTAERFLPDPFGDAPGARLYASGDAARWLPDGTLEFLGRLDDQVKLRGHRIELGEVEAAIGQHPAVRQVAVVIGDRRHNLLPAGDSLLAYVCLTPDTALDPADLRRHLHGKLPDYMLPTAFVPLDALPLTPNGKVDRRALQALHLERPPAPPVEVAPRSPTEEIVAGIWRAVLGLPQVDVHANFFELGGHSLLATQLISRIRTAFQLELQLHALFETPTVAGLAQRLDAAQLEPLAAPPLRPVAHPDNARLPLSFAQQRLWFLDQLEPDNPFYNIPAALSLKGPLNLPALHLTFDQIVRRHDALRTAFVSLDGQPAQVISPALHFNLPLIDLLDLPPAQATALAHRLASEEAHRPFRLSRPPLLRATLLRLAPDEHVLLLTLHHIISDGWSTTVLTRELAALYRAAADAQPANLPDLPLQYPDYALWQRAWLQGPALDAQLSYWQRQLADLPPALALPADRPRPPIQSFRGRQLAFSLSPQLSSALKALAQREQVTLFMLLLAAFKVLLYRYTGQADIVVGTPIANRTRSEVEGLIGFFVNTLALRSDLSGRPSFREVLSRVRAVALAAYAHQDAPFEMVVEAVQPARDLSRPPLFQVMFTLQNAPLQLQVLHGLATQLWDIDIATAKFDLSLALVDAPSGFTGTFEYNIDLFEAETISGMAEHFQRLLTSVIADPGLPITDLTLLPEAERRQLLVEWNDTRLDYPRDQCLHELFETQAAWTPDALALIYQDEHLTYRCLNERANALAHHLQSLGVAPETPVGICLKRSVELVIALLGVLKAGGAYVPLDPNYPRQRLAFILEDTQAPIVLTQPELTELLPVHITQVVTLQPGGLKPAPGKTLNPCPAMSQANLAYFIYTSGSTGRPKGVAIEHRCVVAFIHWAAGVFGAEPLAGMLASTSICFDLSVFELFLPLCQGGAVILAENALELPSLPACHAVRLVNTVPSAIQALLNIDGLPESVQVVNLAGERLATTVVEQLYRLPTIEAVHDLYGPSETTTYSTYTVRSAAGPETIGRPIANTRVYLLDAHGQPAPIGVMGELYIGGEGVARGYLDRPELTAERFVPESFGDETGARLYRTGDLARYRRDGSLEFLGRIDHQVKIRGHRIELGEIETALHQHPAVHEAVVVACNVGHEATAEEQLIASVVLKPDAALTTSELRQFLQTRLPGYMLPSRFVLLDTLPRTPNGKIDRRALLASGKEEFQAAGAWDAPRDSLELRLVQIWEDVLSVQSIGVKQSFFELGGHSLLAVRLMARIERELKQRLPVVALFQHDTIERLASVLRRHDQAALASSPLVALRIGDSIKPPLFLVHPIGGSVWGYINLVRHLPADQTVYGLQAGSLDAEAASPTCLEDMARRYLALLRSVQPSGPYHLGGWSMGGVVAFEIAQQLFAQQQDVALLVLFDAHLPNANASPEPDETELLASLALNLGLPLEIIAAQPQPPAQSTLDERLANLLELLKQTQVATPDMELSDLRRLFHTLKSNLRALRQYVPQPYAGSIVLFQAGERVRAGQDPAEMSGWLELAGGGLSVQEAPGNHYTLMHEPGIAVLAEQLRAHLAAVEPGRRGIDCARSIDAIPSTENLILNQLGG